jgi:copper chaperone CopZ
VKACGHCVEDKMAAVYDFAVVSKARARHQHVAFVALDGAVKNDARTHAAITGIVQKAEGVERASVRVSLELAAFSFAYDPKRASFAVIHRSIGRQLSHAGLRISEIKILDGSGPVQRTADR